MNTMKVIRTHVHAVYEKIQVLHRFRFGADRRIILINSIYTIDRGEFSFSGS